MGQYIELRFNVLPINKHVKVYKQFVEEQKLRWQVNFL